MSTDAEKYARIVGIVRATDDRRNRERREAWERIKDVIGNDQNDAPQDDEPAAVGRPATQAGVLRWREYAESIGVEVPEDATKSEIVTAVTAAEAKSED